MSINEVKTKQLGMPAGTATAILRKNVLFNILKKHKENICFQCGEEIQSVEELSMEHKIPWLHSGNPTELFFSIDNIAFSHLSCNIRNARHNKERNTAHGTETQYRFGCRCEECKESKKLYWRKYRKNK